MIKKVTLVIKSGFPKVLPRTAVAISTAAPLKKRLITVAHPRRDFFNISAMIVNMEQDIINVGW